MQELRKKAFRLLPRRRPSSLPLHRQACCPSCPSFSRPLHARPFVPRASHTLYIRWIVLMCTLCALCMRTVYAQRASNTLCMRCQLASFSQILTKVGRTGLIFHFLTKVGRTGLIFHYLTKVGRTGLIFHFSMRVPCVAFV